MALNSSLVHLCSKCKMHLFKTSPQFAKIPFFLNTSSRGYKWRSETHYDVLGVHPDASQKEIKTAYLSLSKELHPDLNQRATKQDKELIHKKFVKVTEAYSTLSNKAERRTYDVEAMIRSDTRINQDASQDGSGRAHARTQQMTFEERARAMGYAQQDPDYYKKNKDYHKKVLIACVVWIIGGCLISSKVIMTLYHRHTTEMDYATKVNNEVLMASREKAKMRGSLEDQKNAFDKLWTDEKVKRDEP